MNFSSRFSAYVSVDAVGDAHGSGLSERLQPCRDVDRIADRQVEVHLVAHQHVAKMDADPDFQAGAGEVLRIDPAQDRESGVDGSDDRVEGREERVAGARPPPVRPRRQRCAHCLVQPVDRLRGALVVLAHQRAVPAHVGEQHRADAAGEPFRARTCRRNLSSRPAARPTTRRSRRYLGRARSTRLSIE